MKTLIKTVVGNNGKLYVIKDGCRTLLSGCMIKFEIYENKTSINTLGIQSTTIRSNNISIVICSENEFTRDIDVDYLKNVSRFEVVCDIQGEDGVFERFVLDNIVPVDIEINGDWTFDLVNTKDIISKLSRR